MLVWPPAIPTPSTASCRSFSCRKNQNMLADADAGVHANADADTHADAGAGADADGGADEGAGAGERVKDACA